MDPLDQTTPPALIFGHPRAVDTNGAKTLHDLCPLQPWELKEMSEARRKKLGFCDD